jgi:hypothetical protein
MSDNWEVGALKLKEIPSQTEENLKALAKDIAMGKVFTDQHISPGERPRIIGSVFLILVLGALKDYSEEAINDIGMIYEYYDKASPRSVNGYPMFFSCAILNSKDAAYVWKRYEEVKQLLEGI